MPSETIPRLLRLSCFPSVRSSDLSFIPAFLVGAAAMAGPADSAIVAAMKIPEAPNYSWRAEVVDDARSYEIIGATDRATDYSLVTLPLPSNAPSRRGPGGSRGPTSNVTTVVFKGAIQYAVQVDEAWRLPSELPSSSGRRSGGPGGPPGSGRPPGSGGPPGSSGRGRGPGGGEAGKPAAYSNVQNSLSRPHEEIGVIVAGASDFKSEDGVISGKLTEIAAALLLVRPGQKDIEPRRASGTFRFWIQEGMLVKYETQVEGVLSVLTNGERREVTVNQTTTTSLSQVGTTTVDIPAEAKRKLGG